MIFWSHSWHDLQVRTKLKVQYDLRKVLSATESLQLVASQVFGGGTKSKGEVVEVDNWETHDWSKYA